MLDALYKLGKLYIEKENLDQIDVLLDNKKIGAVVLVEFIEDSKGNFSYNKIYHEDYDKQNKVKYLYKKGSSRGTNITPSTLIASSLETTFNKKFFKWFENNKGNGEIFYKLYDEIADNRKIYADLKNIVNEINVRDNILISVVIINNKINYLNDYDEFRDILIKNSLDKYQGPKKIKGNSVCYLCDNHTEVYGLVSNAIGFAFSTPEKIGNVPGTDIKNQWKLLPICSDCALYLNAGKNFIDDYLNFSEFGLTYYIIPSFLFDYKGFDKLYHYLQLFKSEDSLKSQDLLKIENSVSRLLKNFDNYVEFKFLFYKSKNNALDILSYIENVIPSWLNKLYASQIKIEQYNLFHEDELKLIFGKNHNGNFLSLINKNEKKYPCVNDNWYKKFLKDFLADTPKNKKNIDKVYLDIVSDIISNSKVDYNFLLSKFMNEMRFQWRNERYHDLKISVLKALMLILLLNDLNIFYGGNKLNFDNEEFSIELILDSSSKKASFLLGVLTRKLLNKQLRELDSTPFFNKLWGLSLDHKKIKKLYPMVINKLREYNITYLELEKEISNNLILSEKDWNLTRDETSYYFVLGYTLYKFYLNKGDDKNE